MKKYIVIGLIIALSMFVSGCTQTAEAPAENIINTTSEIAEDDNLDAALAELEQLRGVE